jgi:AhpC/TSA family
VSAGSPGAQGGDGGSAGPGPGPPRRLDPDRAAAARPAPSVPPPPLVDTRRYQRLIGLFGLAVVIVISIAFLTSHRAGTAGIPAGQRLRLFSAPLAASNLQGDANLNPPCTLAQHDPRALNTCLLVKQAPLVLGFFVTDSGACEREVSTMQTLSHQYPGIRFAAVAVHGSHATVAAEVRSHHWTIPVAYDLDGAVGDEYGVEVCPIVELAYRGGVVARRLIGEHWDNPVALASAVSTLASKP